MLTSDLTVNERDGSVNVAMVISGPAGGLECKVIASLSLMGSSKAGSALILCSMLGLYMHAIVIMLCCCSTVEGEDFAASGGLQVTFTSGSPDDAQQSVVIAIIDDDVLEGDHDFTVQLVSTDPSSVMIGAQSDTTVTIIDDEGIHLIRVQ